MFGCESLRMTESNRMALWSQGLAHGLKSELGSNFFTYSTRRKYNITRIAPAEGLDRVENVCECSRFLSALFGRYKRSQCRGRSG